MTKSHCRFGGETLANGNCTVPAEDGLPVQCVGEWAEEKHHYLAQYIHATRAVRSRYIPPQGPGGAAFIDLFAGPGRARIRDTQRIVDGSPLIALSHLEAPFTKVVLCDIDSDNVRSLRERTASQSHRVQTLEGDCNERIEDITKEAPEHGFNIALVDPYALSALKFATLGELARFKRMDLIIHFPTGDIKRNLFQNDSTSAWLDEALGTDVWRGIVKSADDVARLIEALKDQLALLGYGSANVRSLPIKNTQNVTLYYLVYASKSEVGDKIWESIAKHGPQQRGFGF